MSKLSKHHFWKWFKRHQQEYLSLKKKTKKETNYWLHELSAHLRAYYKFFTFSIEYQQDEIARLTISVNGNAKHFKKVEDLVAKAPIIPGWIFVALEDPRRIDFLLEQQIEETGIDPREFYFSIDHDGPYNIVLTVYHPLCTSENEYLLYQLAIAAIYNLLGERVYGTDIGGLEVANLSYADADDVEKLEALPECIAQRRSDMVIDGEGKLSCLN